ncbi:hypothetical protein BZH17_08835 [Salmonella enterica]|nr:hypothetical protein [Salmonella enterica]
MFFTGTFVNPYIFLASFCDDTAPALCSGLFFACKKAAHLRSPEWLPDSVWRHISHFDIVDSPKPQYLMGYK